MSNVGIYAIRNICTGEMYIGQSSNIRNQSHAHLNDLKNNAHHNKHLQESFNSYGINSFEFLILENCPVEKLNELELYYINKYDSINNGFNVYNGGGKGIVRKHAPNGITSIRVHQSTKNVIHSFQKDEESYDDTIVRLIEWYQSTRI